MAGTQLVIQCGVMGVPNFQSYSLQPEGWFPGELAGLLCNSMRILTSLLLESWRRLHWTNSIWLEEFFFLRYVGTGDPFEFISKDYMNYKLFSSIQLQAVGDDVKGPVTPHLHYIFWVCAWHLCAGENKFVPKGCVFSSWLFLLWGMKVTVTLASLLPSLSCTESCCKGDYRIPSTLCQTPQWKFKFHQTK